MLYIFIHLYKHIHTPKGNCTDKNVTKPTETREKISQKSCKVKENEKYISGSVTLSGSTPKVNRVYSGLRTSSSCEFHGNPFDSCCVILVTNQPTNQLMNKRKHNLCGGGKKEPRIISSCDTVTVSRLI